MRPKVQQRGGYIEGYGGTGLHWANGVYNNRLLWRIEGRSESDVAVRAERARVQWEKDWPSKDIFVQAIKRKPLAHSLCSNCSKTCDEMTSYCLDRIWCHRPECQKALDAARVISQKQMEQDRRDLDDRIAQEKRGRIEAIAAATEEGLWRDGWYFRRLKNGAIRVMYLNHPSSQFLAADVTIDAAEWDKIVQRLKA